MPNISNIHSDHVGKYVSECVCWKLLEKADVEEHKLDQIIMILCIIYQLFIFHK
jgi:hypothetical protein